MDPTDARTLRALPRAGMAELSSHGRRAGGARGRGRLFSHRRSGRRRLLTAGIGLAALIVLPAAVFGRGSASSDAAVRLADGSAVAPAPATVEETTTPDGRTVEVPRVFARLHGLDLRLPSFETVLVGYHEASFADALALEPTGEPLANDNRTKFRAPATASAGPEYVVLSSRGRPQAATSAVDLVLRDDDPVLALVSGRVVDVRPYDLYGRYADTRIEIVPLERPDLRVVVIHVHDPAVEVGDVVLAGQTVLADGANRFPFSSHVDRYVGGQRWPHIHVEVKGADPGR